MTELNWSNKQKTIVAASVTEEIPRHIRKQAMINSEISAAIWRGRTAGMTWTELGTLLGISKQAAHKKYSTETSE